MRPKLYDDIMQVMREKAPENFTLMHMDITIKLANYDNGGYAERIYGVKATFRQELREQKTRLLWSQEFRVELNETHTEILKVWEALCTKPRVKMLLVG